MVRTIAVVSVVSFGIISLLPVTRAAERTASMATPVGFEVGVQGSDYRYEEPGLMHLTGKRAGVKGAYTFSTGPKWFGKVDARYSYGELRYEGSGVKESVPDTIIEMRFVESREFVACHHITLSPYGGFGYRYLYNDLRGSTSTGAVGYRRFSNYFYVPLGVAARFDVGSRWVIAPTVEYDFFLQGQQTSKLSDTGLGYSDANNTQDSGYGYRLALMFETGRFAAGPWMHYWSIHDSDVVYIGNGFYGMEPKNWTREVGLELKYRF